jgi:hypothetical protein
MQVIYHDFYRADKKNGDGLPADYDPRTIMAAVFPETGERFSQLTYRPSFMVDTGALYRYEGPNDRFEFRMYHGPGYRRLSRGDPNADTIANIKKGKETRMMDGIIDEFPWSEQRKDLRFFEHFMELVYWEYKGNPNCWGGDYEVIHDVPYGFQQTIGFRMFTYDKAGFHSFARYP